MINIRPLIEQRIYAQVPAFKEVAGAASLTNVLSGRLSAPGCYVFQESERAGQNVSVVGTVQQTTRNFAVVIVVQSVKDARGSDAADVCYALQESTKTALIGWTPSVGWQDMQYQGGQLISFANGFFIWKDSYTTFNFIQA